MKKLLVLFLLSYVHLLSAQTDQEQLKTIYKQSLTNGKSYQWLDYLSNTIGGRLSGSENAQKAVEYTKSELDNLGLDKVWLQPVLVPKWVRGEKEEAYFKVNQNTTTVNICALGGSIATPSLGLESKVVEVQNFEELIRLGEKNIKGKKIS